MATMVKHKGLTLSKGNMKLDKSIAIWNLPAIKTCPNCSTCAKTCYAMRAQRMYPNVRACRDANWQASKDPLFTVNMVEAIRLSKCKVVRIHESGDFYSQEYANSWSIIASMLPEVQFYAYTKSPYRPVGSNLNIVESILPNGSVNYGTLEHCLKAASEFGAFVCPCKPRDREKHCGSTCTVCQTAKYVVFLAH